MKPPIIVSIARLLILAVWGAVIYFFWHLNLLNAVVEKVTVTSGAFLFVLVSSFFRSRWSLWILAFFWTAMPLFFWVSFNNSEIVHGTWWEWLIMLPAQMAIPVALSYTLLMGKDVRKYFCWQ
jgi:hypothetical protein